ncbi:hypothetical protein [Sphingomonas sp. ID0503]|uniref:hypothetical protein n=1 Tax=Sphingomonas sp. ID0503 TaxID=3399691 RepID=UPI003AFA9E38
MSGGAIMGALLTAHAPLTAIVPMDGIRMDVLPSGWPLPGITVGEVSGNDRQKLCNGIGGTRVTDRVQVTVHARDVEQRAALILLVRAAGRGRIGSIAGLTGVSVLVGAKGPTFRDDAATIFMQSQDFMVSYIEAA